MPFSLMQDEETLHERSYSSRLLFWGATGHFRITSRRLAFTWTQFGSEEEKYIPLENVDSMQEGQSSPMRWMIFAIILAFAGLLVTVGTLGFGIVVAIPLWLVAAFCLLMWFLKRRRVLVIKSGNNEIELEMSGLVGYSGSIGQLLSELEAAREARVRALNG